MNCLEPDLVRDSAHGGRAEQGIGEPEIVAACTFALYHDLIDALAKDLEPGA